MIIRPCPLAATILFVILSSLANGHSGPAVFSVSELGAQNDSFQSEWPHRIVGRERLPPQGYNTKALEPVPGDEFWQDGFGRPGVDGYITSMVVFDGDLIVAGRFSLAGSILANNIARWDGTTWSPLGIGTDDVIYDLAVFGGDLVAGGGFVTAGDKDVSFIASWDGSTWNPLGNGFNDWVSALTVYNDTLIAGGFFIEADSDSAGYIAQWDGISWKQVGHGLNSWVSKVEVYGDRLVANSYFGERCCSGVSEWDGNVWRSIELDGYVYSFFGSGDSLFIGGYFSIAGEPRAARIASWDGNSLKVFGSDLDFGANTLRFFEGALVAGGSYRTGPFSSNYRLAGWDGTSWVALVDDNFGSVSALETYQENLVAGGDFSVFEKEFVNNVTIRGEGPWKALGSGAGMSQWVATLRSVGGSIIAGGQFTYAGAQPANHIARWDGLAWHPLGSGTNALVFATESYAGNIVAGGLFSEAGGLPAKYIAQWNGETWSVLGPGFDDAVWSLAVFQGDLIAGGRFRSAGDLTVNAISRWDGASWYSLGTGLTEPSLGREPWVFSSTIHNGELVVGGIFDKAGGRTVNNIARWNGSLWRSFGSGASGVVEGVTVHNGDLVACVNSFSAEAVPRSWVARWNGISWVPMGEGFNSKVWDATVLNNVLVVVGNFTESGGKPLAHVAYWDGEGWQPLGSGLGANNPSIYLETRTVTELNGSLYVGGHFTTAGDKPSFYIARWDGLLAPVLVKLTFFEAERWIGRALVRWKVSDNFDHAGFHVYRQKPSSERQKLTDHLLTGQTEYEFTDPTPPRTGAEYWLAEISRTGETTWHGPAVLPPASLPARLTLGPGVPNPFRSQTQIAYSIPGTRQVELAIYDLQGRRIATLINKEQGPGEYTVSWDGRVDTGMAPSGLYFLRLRAGKSTKTQKLMFVR